MRIYISGPMRGKPDFNFPAFDLAAARIRNAGWTPVSPADLDRQSGEPMSDSRDFIRRAMKRDTDTIFECDEIALLPGWRQSAGAVTEVALSCVLAMPARDAITLHDITEDIREWWRSLLGRERP